MWSLIVKLWFFLWDTFMGEITLTQAIKTSKLKLAVIALTCCSVFANYFLIKKLYGLGEDFIELRKQKTALEAQVKDTHQVPALKAQIKTLTEERDRLLRLAKDDYQHEHPTGVARHNRPIHQSQTDFFLDLEKRERQEQNR